MRFVPFLFLKFFSLYDNQSTRFQSKSVYVINFQVYQVLVEKTKSTPGAMVENNKFCASVHFRCVDEKV